MTFCIKPFAAWIVEDGTNFDSSPSWLGRPALEDGELEDEVEDETGLKYLYKDITSDY